MTARQWHQAPDGRGSTAPAAEDLVWNQTLSWRDDGGPAAAPVLDSTTERLHDHPPASRAGARTFPPTIHPRASLARIHRWAFACVLTQRANPSIWLVAYFPRVTQRRNVLPPQGDLRRRRDRGWRRRRRRMDGGGVAGGRGAGAQGGRHLPRGQEAGALPRPGQRWRRRGGERTAMRGFAGG